VRFGTVLPLFGFSEGRRDASQRQTAKFIRRDIITLNYLISGAWNPSGLWSSASMRNDSGSRKTEND